MADELIWTSAHELGKLYRDRSVSPVEVVDAVLERLEKVNPAINAFVTVTADSARAQAKEAEKRFAAGDDLPALYGVPITVKDLTETAGVRTTYGSPAFADNVPDEDNLEWSRLKAAGPILIGKTTTPEFGLLGVTESYLTGSTGTPWDPTRTSGGSSGGAASSVVAGVGPLAWGSDGGGSIRVPASVCGAVGVKTSAGRIAHIGRSDPDETEGPLTRLVVDSALLLDVTVGPDPRDRTCLPATGENYTDIVLAPGDLSGLRIAASPDFNQGPVDPETRRVFTAAFDDLRAAGAVVEEVEMDLPDAAEFFFEYWGADYVTYIEEMRAANAPIWPELEVMLARSSTITAAQTSAAMREKKTRLYDGFETVFRNFDLLITPTTPIPAFPHNGPRGGVEEIDGVPQGEMGMAFHRMTELPSHAGLPAVSINCGFTRDRLPVGLQIIGPQFADAAVMSAAARYERATTWHLQHPEF